MTTSRRSALRRIIAIAATVAAGRPAAAESYPSRPIQLYVAFGPGGAGDIAARVVANEMSKSLGQPIVVENRPAPTVAARTTAKAKPDGYTLMVAGSGTALTEVLFKSLPYDLTKDFIHVSTMASFDLVLITGTQKSFRTVADVVSFAKKNPGRLTIGSARVGSTQHLTAEMFKSMAGIDAAVVPSKSTSDLVVALRSGDVDVAFEIAPPVLSQIRSNALRALAVTSTARYAGLPQIPTMAESGLAGFESTSWNGISAPAGTPPDVIERLNKEIRAAVAAPGVQRQLEAAGMVGQASTPEQMLQRMRQDVVKWATVIRSAGIERR